MTPFEFGLLAGVLAGLGAARLRHPADVASRSGTVGLLAAAAGTALLSSNVGVPVGTWIEDLTGLSSTAPLLTHLLLIIAAVAGCTHLLGKLVEDARVTYAAITVSGIAAVVMVWQWLAELAHPELGVLADTRWYLVAFFTGLALPLLIVFGAAVRARTRSGYVWATVLAAGSAAGALWCAWRATAAVEPELAAKLPEWVGGLLILITGAGLWAGNLMSRFARPVEDEAPTPLDALPADTGDFPVVEPQPEPEPLPEPVDPEQARERAASVAAALSDALAEVGRDTAVAVGAIGDDLVFCTADGLGFLPEDGAGDPHLVPLITRVPSDFTAKWIGCAHPQMPLLAAAEQGHVPEYDATVTIGPGGDLSTSEIDGIERANLSAPRSRTDSVAVSETYAVLDRLRRDWNADLDADPSERATKTAEARWTMWPDLDYPKRWAAELLARAAADLDTGDVDSARYVLRSALRIPLPEEPAPAPAPAAAPAAPTAAINGTAPLDALAGLSTSRPVPVAPAARVAPPELSTSIAAALSKQIPGDAEIAVAVDAHGAAVFATSDGLGYLPEGAHADDRVTPLITLVDEAFVARWLGCDRPHEALLAAAAEGAVPEPVELVTTCTGSTGGAVVSIDESDLAAAEMYTLLWSRESLDAIDEDEIVAAYSEVTSQFGFPADTPDAAQRSAAALRWTDVVNPEYAREWARYLITETSAAVSRDDKASARYLLRNVLRIPATSNASSA